MNRHRFLILVCLLATACSAAAEERRLTSMVQPDASVSDFVVCHGSDCRFRSETGLTDEEWSKIEGLFDPAAETAEDERKQIAKAIGLIERYVGPKTNTQSDAGRNRPDPNQATQLDCIDEAVNTTTYLRLIDAAGLLQWHDVALPAHREAEFLDFHNTAAVVSKDDGVAWAVDSWFGPNGAPASVVPLDAWRSGWEPGRTLPTVTQAETPNL
jgi:hypothetical protein